MVNLACVGVVLLLLIGLGVIFHIVLKITPEESFTTAIMSIMSILYLTGLFGNTKFVLLAVYVLGAIGLLVGVAFSFLEKRFSLLSFMTPAIVMVCAMTGIVMVAFHGFHICNWDELFQWGKAANYMVQFDKLPKDADFTGQNILMSTTTIFHYYIAKFGMLITGKITESDYYVSNVLLWFSAFVLPFSGTGWKSCKRVFLFGTFQFLLVAMLFVQPYYNIYTDQATAYWAGAMIAWLLLEKCNDRNMFLIPLVLANVGMMKNMVGPLFACIVLGAIVVNYCSECKCSQKRIISGFSLKTVISKKGLIGLLAIVSTVLYTVIWSFVIRRNAVYRGVGILTQVETGKFEKTIKAMVAKVFEPINQLEGKWYLTYLSCFLITVLIVVLVYPIVLEKKECKRFQNLLYVYLIGYAGYFLVMVYAYMKVFAYNDSVNATSLERYFSDYVMLGMIPLMIPIFMNLQRQETGSVKNLKYAIILGSMVVILCGCSKYILPRFAHIYAVDTENYKERERFVKYAKNIKEITEGNGKIYFVNQSKTGLFTLVADYELGSQLTREGMCFNFRKDTKTPINGLLEYPIEDLPEVLLEDGYDYLWVYSSNDYFTENVEALFDTRNIETGNFYRIIQKDRKVELELIKKIK